MGWRLHQQNRYVLEIINKTRSTPQVMSVFSGGRRVVGLKSRQFQGSGSRAQNSNIAPNLFPRLGQSNEWLYSCGKEGKGKEGRGRKGNERKGRGKKE